MSMRCRALQSLLFIVALYLQALQSDGFILAPPSLSSVAAQTSSARWVPTRSRQLPMTHSRLPNKLETSGIGKTSTEMANAQFADMSFSILLALQGAESVSVIDAVDPVIVGLSRETTIAVFIVGLIPFGVATFEFWRRIAVGASFGTADEQVVFTIGEDDAPANSRGKQVLGKDALLTAYAIFTVAAIVLGIVLYSVLTSPIPV